MFSGVKCLHVSLFSSALPLFGCMSVPVLLSLPWPTCNLCTGRPEESFADPWIGLEWNHHREVNIALNCNVILYAPNLPVFWKIYLLDYVYHRKVLFEESTKFCWRARWKITSMAVPVSCKNDIKLNYQNSVHSTFQKENIRCNSKWIFYHSNMICSVQKILQKSIEWVNQEYRKFPNGLPSLE